MKTIQGHQVDYRERGKRPPKHLDVVVAADPNTPFSKESEQFIATFKSVMNYWYRPENITFASFGGVEREGTCDLRGTGFAVDSRGVMLKFGMREMTAPAAPPVQPLSGPITQAQI